MTQTNDRAPLRNVTIVPQKVTKKTMQNENKTKYLLVPSVMNTKAKGEVSRTVMAFGKAQSALETVLRKAAKASEKVNLYGVWDGGVFNAIGVAQPKPKAEAEA